MSWRDLSVESEAKPLPTSEVQTASSPPVAATAPVDGDALTALTARVLTRESAYSSFVRVYEGLAMLSDPDTRFQAALAAVKAHGATVHDVVDAIGLHQADLVAQEHAFEATLKAQTEQQVEEKRRHAAEVDKAL